MWIKAEAIECLAMPSIIEEGTAIISAIEEGTDQRDVDTLFVEKHSTKPPNIKVIAATFTYE